MVVKNEMNANSTFNWIELEVEVEAELCNKQKSVTDASNICHPNQDFANLWLQCFMAARIPKIKIFLKYSCLKSVSSVSNFNLPCPYLTLQQYNEGNDKDAEKAKPLLIVWNKRLLIIVDKSVYIYTLIWIIKPLQNY